MTRLPGPQPAENDRGIAESVGTILLISVIALGIAVFAVALFSQQAAPVLPSVIFDVTCGENGSVAIRHLGGDTIPRDQLRIYVDNGTTVLGNEAFSDGNDDKGWTAWNIGDILVYEPTPSPGALVVPKAEVLIVYADPAGGEYLLHISDGWKGPIPTPTGTPEPTQVPLVASFHADRTSGSAPLEVQFTDTSVGDATSWTWDFGDDSISTVRNPVHTYPASGTYTIRLTVTKAGASDTEVKTNYITVTSYPTRYDTLLNAPDGKPGDLRPDSYLEFQVSKPGIWVDAYVVMTNARYELANGDTVKLVIGTKGKGEIYINGPMLSTFDYDDVTLYVNGEQMETGDIVSIYLLQENLSSTLTLNVPSSNLWTELRVGDNALIHGEDSRKITLCNLMPRKDGLMNLNNQPNLVWFQGSVTGYTLE